MLTPAKRSSRGVTRGNLFERTAVALDLIGLAMHVRVILKDCIAREKATNIRTGQRENWGVEAGRKRGTVREFSSSAGGQTTSVSKSVRRRSRSVFGTVSETGPLARPPASANFGWVDPQLLVTDGSLRGQPSTFWRERETEKEEREKGVKE